MRQRLTPKEALWYALAFVVLILLVAPSASAKIGTPDECSQTAMAALKVAHLKNPKASNYVEDYFIQLSQYLWHQTRGHEARFLRAYRKACEAKRAPRFIRVRGNRVVKGAAA